MKRVAIVTGASRSIGRDIARKFARTGHFVACFARDGTSLRKTARSIEADGGECLVSCGDVTNDADRSRLVAETLGRWGRIDVLVNNAGIVRECRAQDMSVEAFKEVLDVDLVSCFALSVAAKEALAKSGSGCIINIGSLFGSVSAPRSVSYSAAKAGLAGLTRALAVEWAPDNIRCVCVAPGYIETGVSRLALDDPQLAKRILTRIPARRFGTGDDVAELVCFLASSQAAFITGSTFTIDGGQHVAA